MRASDIEDYFVELSAFTESVYLGLTLAALKRTLTEEELHFFQRAAGLLATIHADRFQALGTGVRADA